VTARRPRALIWIFAGAACALVASPRAAIAQPGPESPPALSAARVEKAIHDLVNRERRAQKLKPLALDGRLAGVARGHSRDMAKRNYFSHDSPEGERFSGRYRRARYVCAVREGRTTYRGAENIWRGYQYTSVRTVNGTKHFDWSSEANIARTVVDDWMKSPGHRANILTARLTRQGIGLAVTPDRQIYVTQNFC
jgi:uncharacterized protein YkwD